MGMMKRSRNEKGRVCRIMGVQVGEKDFCDFFHILNSRMDTWDFSGITLGLAPLSVEMNVLKGWEFLSLGSHVLFWTWMSSVKYSFQGSKDSCV